MADNNDVKNENLEQTNNQPEKQETKPDTKNERTTPKYSDEDLDKIIDKKFAKWKEAEDERVKEAERLAKMNAQQKAEHERDLEKKRADDAEAKLNRFGLTEEARQMLSSENINISSDLLSMLVGVDADVTKTNVESFVSLFNNSVEAEVKKRIAGTTPKTGSKAKVTKADILKVSDPVERRKLIAENIELFN